MPVIILNANVAAVWCSAIATIGSPTAAELNGGIRLENWLTSDGLTVGPKLQRSPTGNLGSKYDTEQFSTVGYDVKMKFHHDTVTDTAWTTFPFKTAGYLAIRRGLAKATTFATGQGGGGPTGTLRVLKLECGITDEVDPPNNWDFELEFALIGDPADRAVVA